MLTFECTVLKDQSLLTFNSQSAILHSLHS